MLLLQHELKASPAVLEQAEVIEERLSGLYVRRDECWLTGEECAPLQSEIDAIERQYHRLCHPCHLCDRPTLFHEAAFGLPFCWTCLHERYDWWYRSVAYKRNGCRK
jgi:hypothetical protein